MATSNSKFKVEILVDQNQWGHFGFPNTEFRRLARQAIAIRTDLWYPSTSEQGFEHACEICFITDHPQERIESFKQVVEGKVMIIAITTTECRCWK